MPAFDFSSLTYFDYIVLVIIGLSAVFSMLRGMTREFLGLAGWVLAVFIAVTTAPFMTDWLSSFLKVDGLTDILSWALPFTATVVIWFILASLISPGLKRAGLGALDTWFGILFGVLRGVLFSMILYSGCVIYVGEETALDKGILESQAGPYISRFVRSVQNSTLLPSLATDSLNNIRLNTDWPTLGKELGEAVDEGAKTVSDKLNLLTDEK
ncbi:MAG: CvpA family protein [Candidatus Puniceispirillaceae bacterium]|jgi:membrane protein required for colicin V production